MKRSEAFPSKFISKDDVTTPLQVTIESVEHDTVKDDNGDKTVTVMSFVEAKPLIINVTNWMVLEDAWGDDTDLWIGKVIELYHDPAVMFGGKRVGGVRIRIPQVKPTVAVNLGGDAATLFWAKAYQMQLPHEQVQEIIESSNKNFVTALDELTALEALKDKLPAA